MSQKEKMLETLRAKLKIIFPYLNKNYQIRTLEIFGSYIRGEEREGSDLDLLVTFNQTPSLFQFVALKNYLSEELGIEVDLVMKDCLKPTIGKRILDEAQPI